MRRWQILTNEVASDDATANGYCAEFVIRQTTCCCCCSSASMTEDEHSPRPGHFYVCQTRFHQRRFSMCPVWRLVRRPRKNRGHLVSFSSAKTAKKSVPEALKRPIFHLTGPFATQRLFVLFKHDFISNSPPNSASAQ